MSIENSSKFLFKILHRCPESQCYRQYLLPVCILNLQIVKACSHGTIAIAIFLIATNGLCKVFTRCYYNSSTNPTQPSSCHKGISVAIAPREQVFTNTMTAYCGISIVRLLTFYTVHFCNEHQPCLCKVKNYNKTSPSYSLLFILRNV